MFYPIEAAIAKVLAVWVGSRCQLTCRLNLYAHAWESTLTSRVSTASNESTHASIAARDGVDDAIELELPGSVRGAREAVSESRGPSVVAQVLAAHRRRGGGGRSGGGASADDSRAQGLLSDDELDAVEETHDEGLTVVQIVDIFTSRGVRLSEASFRKYVQQGLLPRSRRVGRKGKHRGSMGVYPVKTIRRLNELKRLMGEGYTIEEIQAQFLRFTDVIETLKEGFDDVFARLAEEVSAPRFDTRARRSLNRELADANHTADELMRRLDTLVRRVSSSRAEQYRSTGAAGSAEDLL